MRSEEFILYPSNSLVFDFHQAADGIQEQQRQEQAGKKYVVVCQIWRKLFTTVLQIKSCKF